MSFVYFDVSMGDVGNSIFAYFVVFCSSKKKLERDREKEDVGMVRWISICYLWT